MTDENVPEHWLPDPENPYVREPVARAILELERRGALTHLIVQHGFPPNTTFTCDDCEFAPRCELAFDGWNMDGHCLMDK